jgi:hypothetical protein
MLRALKTVTFLYVPQEDRIAGAINAGHPDAWSCWLTRRLALAVLERATDYIASTSNLAQRAPAELRGEAIAFEREAAIAKTAPAMSQTPPEILKFSTAGAELVDRLTISREHDAFRFELRGERKRCRQCDQARGTAAHSADAARRRRASRLACRTRRRPTRCRSSSRSQNRRATS